MNGFEISSSPSTGLSSVIVGPRTTVRPSVRVGESGSANASKGASLKKEGYGEGVERGKRAPAMRTLT